LDKFVNDYGKKSEGDFWGFNLHNAIETVAEALGIEYEYPPVDYTIYV
jgi:hypothetical protein